MITCLVIAACQQTARVEGVRGTGAIDEQTASQATSMTTLRGYSSGEQRVALIIGNNSYHYVSKLDNAVADALSIRRELAERGFEIVYHEDADRHDMNNAIDDFIGKLSSNSIGLIYYSGHGIQINGSNYLIPIDLKAERENDVANDAIELSRILDRVTQTQAKFTLAIVDACRDNPFKNSGRAIGGRGLAPPVSNATGIMVVYSAGANQQALDRLGSNDRDPNGLFTREFLKAIRMQGLKVQDAINEAKMAVIEKAKAIGHVQTPAIYDQSVGTFYFSGSSAGRPGTAPISVALPTDRDTVFWQSIQASNNPDSFNAYLSQFPNGTYAALARVRIDELNKQQVVAAPPVASPVPASVSPVDQDALFWRSIQASNNVADFHAYLGQFPNGAYTSLARNRIAELSQLQVALVPGTPMPTPALSPSTTPAPAPAPRGTPGTGATWTDPTSGIEFVWVPGGTYQMGCGPWAGECSPTEGPVHAVTVAGFWLGRTPVTQGQWRRLMGNNPSNFQKGDSYPVELVSWNDAQSFISALNSRSHGFRLPSEAEWEYACRSGGGPEMYCGGGSVDTVAWYEGNAGSSPHPVGNKAPNGLGLYDMSGNVWQWVEDSYRTSYNGAPSNGSAWTTTDSNSARVVRGGSWSNLPERLRSSYRNLYSPVNHYGNVGFRVARTFVP